MKRVIRILARVAPGDVHFTRRQVNHHGVDGLLAVERIFDINGVVADGIREIGRAHV